MLKTRIRSDDLQRFGVVLRGVSGRGTTRLPGWSRDLSFGEPDSTATLAHSLDGSVLYGGNYFIRRLVTIDPATGAVTTISPVDLPDDLTGLSFDPDDGTLFGILAGGIDEVVTIDPATGTVTSTVGPIGFPGPEGLAFIPIDPFVPIPVPSASWLGVLIVSASIALAARYVLRRP